jgi:hypothetical protein
LARRKGRCIRPAVAITRFANGFGTSKKNIAPVFSQMANEIGALATSRKRIEVEIAW